MMDPADKKLSLPAFLKMLSNGSVPVSKAMAVASKIYKEFNTPAALAQLDDVKLKALALDDRELRRSVLAAVRKAGHTTKRVSSKTETVAPEAGPSSSTPWHAIRAVAPLLQTTPPSKKKRKRDDDLDGRLPETPPDEASAFGNLDFGEVLDDETLETKSTVVNRAPLMTAWATVVAERLGFEREEALSIASVYTEMNAVAKGISLGLVEQSRKKEIETLFDGNQPYVDLMGRRPLYQTRSSTWLALSGGAPAPPSTAFSYVSRAFRQTTPYVLGALRLLAASYAPQELNRKGYSLYAEFRPAVDGWGKRGEVRCAQILSLRASAPESKKG